MCLKKFAFVFVAIGLISFISASFEIGNLSHTINTQYGPESFVRGWINISLDEESSESLFESSLGGSIKLMDLLDKNGDVDYSCSTTDCSVDYSSTGAGATMKSFGLGNGESKLLGLKFTENIIAINSISFTLTSDASSSCFNQLNIDILEDNTNDYGNYKSTSIGGCSLIKKYGCFNESISVGEYQIEKAPSKHCQRILMTNSPGFKLGAYVKKNSGTSNLTIGLYDLYGTAINGASCTIPASSLQEAGSEVSCEVNYFIPDQKEYYVCIYAKDTTTSQIVGYETGGEICGYRNYKPEVASFRIFAEGKKFDAVGTIQITNLFGSNTLSGEVSDYLMIKYGNMDCASEPCYAPIKITSTQSQNIELKNLTIKYETQAGAKTKNDFYELVRTPATVSSGFQKIFITPANFSVSDDYGKETFKLSLNGSEIFSEKIYILEVPIIKSLSPTKTASAYPTNFSVDVEAETNISEYVWDFGDGNEASTSKNSVVHKYNNTGTYSLKITVTDAEERVSYETFTIKVESPKELINRTLEEMKEDLENVEEQLEEFNDFEQEQLEIILDLDNLGEILKETERDYKSAGTEAEYNEIITEILGLKIPKSVSKTQTTNDFSFYPNKNVINLDVLKNVGGGDYAATDYNDFLDAIIAWNQQDAETKISFKEFSAKYGNSYGQVMNYFEIKVKEKDSWNSNPFFIIKKLEGLKFKGNPLAKETGNFVYIELTKSDETLSFVTTENVNFETLPAFISPALDRLVLVQQPIDEEKESNKKWWIFGLVILLLALIGIGSYIFLQQWYKYKYERFLFKDRNNLYNLVTYIESVRKKGMSENEIKGKLHKTGWNYEQINYAMKKHSGKRTGMMEIFPIEKFFKKKPNVKK